MIKTIEVTLFYLLSLFKKQTHYDHENVNINMGNIFACINTIKCKMCLHEFMDELFFTILQ